jgi:hypothetical protein
MAEIMTSFSIKQGDTAQPLVMQICDRYNGGTVPVNLTAALSIKVIIIGLTVPFSNIADANTLNPLIGTIQYEWPADVTAAPGTYLLEVEVTMPGPKPRRYPTHGYVQVIVEPKLETTTS